MTVALPFSPLRDGYQAICSYPVVAIALDGGPSRRRLDYLFTPHTVELTWLLTSPQEYTNFMGFFRSTVKMGTQPFLVDLITDVGIELPHKCRCSGSLPRLTQQRGHGYWVAATLEVEPNPTFTGEISYFNSGPFPSLTLPSGSTIGADFSVLVGDIVRVMNSSGVHEDGDVPLDFDGDYEVSVVNTGSSEGIVVDDATSVSSSWTTLIGLDGSSFGPSSWNDTVITTVTRIPS